MPQVTMRSFATLAALAAGTNALVPRQSSGCCFHITASGGASGPMGQLGDGQNRVGGDSASLPEGQYCIGSDGSLTDGNGRGCILTPPTTQLQCDTGATPTPGFSVGSDGQLMYNGSPDFTACQTGQNGEMNVYTSPDHGDVTGCVSVQLSADSCMGEGPGGSGGGGAGPSGSGSTMMPTASPSAPGGGGEGPGSEGPGQGGSTTSPAVPGGGGAGEGPGSEAPSQSTMTVPAMSGDCSECDATSTVWTTVTVDCDENGNPMPPGGGGGMTPTTPAGGGESPTMPAGGGETPTTPAGGGETPTMPAGGGETPSSPAGGGETPTMPAGGGETPSSPAGGGETSTLPAGGGETPTSPAGGGETPSSPAGGGGGGSETPTPSTSQGNCPTDLSGPYETPHLIVPVDSDQPDQSYGTQYNGSVTSSVSTIFNFDIPAEDEGKTCSLVFLFPKKEDLETSSYSFTGDGKLDFSQLESPATESTSYSSAPSASQDLGSQTISPGNSYLVSTFDCPAGKTVGYEISASGNTDLEFFEDWNPSPLGLFITTC